MRKMMKRPTSETVSEVFLEGELLVENGGVGVDEAGAEIGGKGEAGGRGRTGVRGRGRETRDATSMGELASLATERPAGETRLPVARVGELLQMVVVVEGVLRIAVSHEQSKGCLEGHWAG